MGISYEGAAVDIDNFLKVLGVVFSSIFISECLIKIIAIGFKSYLKFGWNQFDFFVVLTSILDIIMD
jgi:hypothetical protein